MSPSPLFQVEDPKLERKTIVRQLGEGERRREDLFGKVPTVVLAHIFSQYLSIKDKLNWQIFFYHLVTTLNALAP